MAPRKDTHLRHLRDALHTLDLTDVTALEDAERELHAAQARERAERVARDKPRFDARHEKSWGSH